ncbi:MAG: Transcriptional regulatory protein DegU [Phycisphaerae bacterium]|nr:Transcriptional regulatory protein DegU [Phycisphaerae bacterium]
MATRRTRPTARKRQEDPAPGPAARVVRVMIVDDHPVVRHGLARLIEDEPDLRVCGLAASATEAMGLLRKERPDLVVVDISLDDINGIELIKQIKAMDPTIRMLVSSMHDESLYAERALHAGARGYVSKHEATETIIQAIRCVMGGGVYLSRSMTEQVLQHVVAGEPAQVASPVEALTDRELEVLEMIGRGLTTREVADRLCLSPKTIETYRANIKRKLNLSNSTRLLQYAIHWTQSRDGERA